MIVVGIDPGVNGAIAILGDDQRDDDGTNIYDMPTYWVTKGSGKKKKRRQVIDLPRLCTLLDDVTRVGGFDRATVVIEDVHAGKQQGAVSMFSMGYGLGVIHGLLTALAQPFELVTPQRWKGVMLDGYATKDKAAARQVAERLFPGVDLGGRKDEGRSDALLIAEWRRRQG